METSEQVQQFQDQQPPSSQAITHWDRAKSFAVSAGSIGAVALYFGMGDLSLIPALVAGGIGAYFSPTFRGAVIDRAPAPHGISGRRAKLKWWLTGSQEPESEVEATEKETTPSPEEEDMFTLAFKQNPLPFERVTMQAIFDHTPRNSYWVWIGRSVTREGHPAVSVNIMKQHLKLIGASQKGKSSMAACVLDQIRHAHDLEHVLIAILDLEDKTGKLFENDPHIVTFRMGAHDIKMHARTKEQVHEYLGYIVQLMNWRYTHTETEVAEMPLLIVYIEEFLALKDHFKRRISWEKDKEQAQADYDTLIYNLSELARRGLKARIQLLLCAQVDYRDEDLYEALANITAGMSFCVKSSAAQAAGFTDAEMLKRNHKDNIVGQAVAEFSGCKDVILAPEYNLEEKLLAYDKAHQKSPSSQNVQRFSLPVQGQADRSEENIQPAATTVKSPLPLVRKRKQATIDDAIEIWNAVCQEEGLDKIGRPRLRTELNKQGFECSDYQSAELLKQILQRIVVDGVGDDDEEACENG